MHCYHKVVQSADGVFCGRAAHLGACPSTPCGEIVNAVRQDLLVILGSSSLTHVIRVAHRYVVSPQTGRIRLNLSRQPYFSALLTGDDTLWNNLPQVLEMFDSQILLTLPIPHV